MRKRANLLCLLLTGALASAQNNSRWADVPASREVSRVGILSALYAPTESDVRLVEPAPPSDAMIHGLAPVFAIELDASSEPLSTSKDVAPDLPDRLQWPDSSGRILAVLPKAGVNLGGRAIRNPWQLRLHEKSKGSEDDFQCGGLIVGGEGGSIAFLNGRAVKRGDDVGKFRVTAVVAAGVILESAGLYFMIPVLRRTSISIVEG